ncbi:MAG: prephenate dehydrogenase/arogenate dehydrogenase family protein [Burkholderiales bacterium]|nr:prephenate dehydrogenase/arogenate dehydrogenase family protein [Burkholderiales bacterium]
MRRRLDTLVVVGVGLIGGSFALALRAAGYARRIVGVGRRRATLEQARSRGIIDECAEGFDCARGATLVMLAMPVGQTGGVLRALAPHLEAGTVVTDAGSTKADVVAAARAELGARIGAFVPGHPVAGTEHSGPAAAFADLYRGRRVVLTPLPETEPRALAQVREAWQVCGARVFELSHQAHDRMLAVVSHLPHLLAFALVDRVAADPRAQELLAYAAGGFRDFTRIASSHPEMWRDICIANREALLPEIDRYWEHLAALRSALESGDAAALDTVFGRAREARGRWLASGEAPEPPRPATPRASPSAGSGPRS